MFVVDEVVCFWKLFVFDVDVGDVVLFEFFYEVVYVVEVVVVGVVVE